jgi:uncharacterized membrane protein YjgN (DUF898 family)
MAADITPMPPDAPVVAAGPSGAPAGRVTRVYTRKELFLFFGSGGEYFRIWIVNILLTMLTFGIYSAWAKVRRTQYFYRNTRLAGASFEYHGDPRAILKGRIIGALLFGAYYAAGLVSPVAGLVAFVALVAILPWLIVRALHFRFYNTSYRGLRFRFEGSTADAYKTFMLWPMATVFTLGLLGPMWHQRLKRYIHMNAAFGRTAFGFDATVGSFYRLYLAALGVLLLLIVGAVVLAGPLLVAGAAGGALGLGIALAMLVMAAAYVLTTVGMWAFTTARVQNLAWNHTQLGPHRFRSEVGAGRLVFITLTNMLGIVCTLGLYKPFADVRLTQYLLDSCTMVVEGSLGDFVAGAEVAVSAAGEEAIEMFDIDLAI